MDISNFDYDLPQELIAQFPPEKRGGSKLLVADLNRKDFNTGGMSCIRLKDSMFSNITEELPDDAFLVVNDSRVMPARIPATKCTGGKSEVFFLSFVDEYSFTGLVKGNLKAGAKLYTSINAAEIILKSVDCQGVWSLTSSIPVRELLEKYGNVPLPPYITRAACEADKERYQTVYAGNGGSVAAPTAGLHFTPEILDGLKKRSIPVEMVTLHVGIGTFRPIKTADINDHRMHTETYHIPDETANRINSYIKEGRRLTAVGTTSVRTLESAADDKGFIKPGIADTALFIKPGYRFKCVRDIITNFHQPRSSLFVLVSSFMGLDFAHNAYRHAIKGNYNFFSYGDAMYIKKGYEKF